MKHVPLVLWGSLFFGGIVVVEPVYAYLDPGSGSMLLQLLLGGVAGITMIVKMYWSRIKEFFGGKTDSASTHENDKSDT